MWVQMAKEDSDRDQVHGKTSERASYDELAPHHHPSNFHEHSAGIDEGQRPARDIPYMPPRFLAARTALSTASKHSLAAGSGPSPTKYEPGLPT